jgi:tetratricopeptide (TPR) repeat protein
MVLKKRDRGGEEREPADGSDASRAARRAARDKAFGRGGEEAEAPSAGRREMPMVGSAREVRRLRKNGPDVAALLEQIKCDEMAAEISKKRQLLYIALAVVGIAFLLWVASLIFHWQQVTFVTKFSILALPICMAFGVNDLCLYIAKTNPVLARRILSLLAFGNPHSVRTLAWLYVDTGDYAKAEKTIASAVKSIDAKKKLRDYILMHAFLANLRAHVGRTGEAEQLVREVLNAAEDHNKQFQTDGSAFLLANTLNYAAQLCDQRDKIQDALALSRRAVRLLCDHPKAPADVALVSLSNAGYYCNVVGEYQEALTYLTKAHELATKTNIARDGQWAFILSNLAIANLGVGRSTMCKRALNDAETRAMAPLGLAERPHTYQCWAIYHFANDRLEYALQSYEKAIEYCSMQNPRDSVLLLRIIKEYSVLLREVGKAQEAAANEQRVTQIRDTLIVNSQTKDKKDKKPKPLAVPTAKSRFPIFWSIFACFYGFLLWVEGLRMAPFTQWLLFLTACVVVIVKIRAKYGPKLKQETSQGAIIAVVSLIPGLRAIVPELSMMPQRTGGIIIGTAVVIAILVKLTTPAPNTVPDFGLLGHEYLILGDELSQAQSFTLARKAYELAVKNGENKFAPSKFKTEFPKVDPSPEALDDNMKALELSQTSPKEARALWEACIRRYPDFEYPYVNLANLISSSRSGKGKGKDDPEAESKSETEESKKDRKSRLVEAERLLQKALVINPNCGLALLNMSTLQVMLERPKASRKYMQRYLKLSGGDGTGLIGAIEGMTKGLPEVDDSTEEPDYTKVDMKNSSVLKDGADAAKADLTDGEGAGADAAAKRTGEQEDSNKKGEPAKKQDGGATDAVLKKDVKTGDSEKKNEASSTKKIETTEVTPKKDTTAATAATASPKPDEKAKILITPKKTDVSTKKDDGAKSDVSTKKNDGAKTDVSTKKNDAVKTDVSTKKNDGAKTDVSTKKNDGAKTDVSTKKNDAAKTDDPSKKNPVKSKVADDDDEWDTPVKSAPSKKTDTKTKDGKSKNWLEEAAEDARKAEAAKAKATKPVAKSAEQEAKSVQSKSEMNKNDKAAKSKDKDKDKKKRRSRRHDDDWMKLSPDDTDW